MHSPPRIIFMMSTFSPRTLRANYQGQSILLGEVFMPILKTNFKRTFTFQTRINYVMLAVITYSLFFDPKKEYSTSYFSNGQKKICNVLLDFFLSCFRFYVKRGLIFLTVVLVLYMVDGWKGIVQKNCEIFCIVPPHKVQGIIKFFVSQQKKNMTGRLDMFPHMWYL